MLFCEPLPRLALAPMAGVTDRAFRAVCRRWGAPYTVSEMVSAKAVCFGDQKSRTLWRPAPEERGYYAVQLFGSEGETMARAAALAWEDTQCQVIDLNMGCPAPKIVSNGDGCALMRRPELAGQIIERVCRAVPVPVTVKFRLGWCREEINYREMGRVAQQAGAAAVCLHARTRTQMYAGKADWAAIADLKRELRIPVIGNGDVFQPQDAVDMVRQTGVDMVMIGRGALGNPWLFARAQALLDGRELPPFPPFSLRLETAREQIALAAADKGEKIALLEARRHLSYYLKGVPGMKPWKEIIHRMETLEDLERLLPRLLEQQRETQELG